MNSTWVASITRQEVAKIQSIPRHVIGYFPQPLNIFAHHRYYVNRGIGHSCAVDVRHCVRTRAFNILSLASVDTIVYTAYSQPSHTLFSISHVFLRSTQRKTMLSQIQSYRLHFHHISFDCKVKIYIGRQYPNIL